MPPLEQPHNGCYLRTCQDIILAVIRKGDLLECDDDVGLQRLKTAVVPVRVKVSGTSYIEILGTMFNIRCVLVSGIGISLSQISAWDN